MNGFNRVIIAGNLTRDPELIYAPSGVEIAKFGLALNRVWVNAEGEKKEEVTFVDVTAFGSRAAAIAQHLKKGRPVLVEGRLNLETWQTQAGDKRSKLAVILEDFTFLNDGRTAAGGAEAGAEGQTKPATQRRAAR